MDSLWEKISSYNIFNNLLPGALYVYFIERTTRIVLSGDEIVKNIILYYFVGLVIGRIGSLLFEPVLKLLRVVKFAPYADYVTACVRDGKIETLQEVANMYRSLFSMAVLLLLSFFAASYITGEKYTVSIWISFLLSLVFIISYVKQIRYIIKRVGIRAS
ncbi:phosphohistidine phosphatase [Enterobacteriaceae bacterium DFI.7.85]|nr:phosphohistidine phosphatase [Enterobacteriaceae bacterium DFI.7.85]